MGMLLLLGKQTSLAAAVKALFAQGQQGFWYDSNDLTTLFQDSAGTTPCTMPGQGVAMPVGLMLDKRLGLTLGSELVTNGTFDANINGWTDGAWTTGSAAAVNGAMQVTIPSGAAYYRKVTAVSLTIGKTYRLYGESRVSSGSGTLLLGVGTSSAGISPEFAIDANNSASFVGKQRIFTATAATMYISAGNPSGTSSGYVADFDNISVRELPGNHRFQTGSTSRAQLSARVNQLLNTATLSTQSVTTAATNYSLYFTGTGSVALSGTATGAYSAGMHTITCTAGTLTLTVTGSVLTADLRAANESASLPPYQRVVDALTYDTAGFPLFIAPDGSDDFMVTNSIDFSGSDKVFVAAGVRKLSDAARGVLLELSTSSANPGAFSIEAPASVADNIFVFYTGATNARSISRTGLSAPITGVATATLDLGAPVGIGRWNGSQFQSNTLATGGGNFGNYPVYFYRRGGTTLPFNGRDYGMICRGGTLPTAAEIAQVERYLASKTGVVLA